MKNEKKKILLVDDDVPTREMYAEVLKNAGLDVVEAGDGIEGLDLATKEKPDAIFTGIIMPRMDGFTLMESLKKNVVTAKIPVIISSHLGREEDQQKANKLGAKDFVVRDVTPPKEVVERIKELFAKGGTYRIQFDPYALDAQDMARESNLDDNYQCLECNEKTIMQITMVDPQEKKFEGKFICPNCGWEAK